ncbi:hypothetical protein HQQ82_07065 [Rathayibacter sp. VKM Ac-2856]|uniref:hypothetical protein n=1 Tax=unclassified Rathayibacter TaxID=2609250 RepID=UPI0015672E84|nr:MULTISPECIES: hypothetical protein [unclassified Rathayibacter]NQX04559.1 hypothetical protein [Rathayibacter sp. VKM Ac-2858]NQX19728.1 hypothetical protein [Rathayibacter sp. VKM Ac-2856]
MKRRYGAHVASFLAAAALAFGGATTASAFPIYENADYGGYVYGAAWAEKDGLGTMNREASSLKAPPGGKTFYEDRGYTGGSVRLSGDVSALTHVTTGLSWPLNWNDRIESYR